MHAEERATFIIQEENHPYFHGIEFLKYKHFLFCNYSEYSLRLIIQDMKHELKVIIL